jgi:hypothetical protein
MPRYKAVILQDHDLSTVRDEMDRRGAIGLYLADTEEAIFFEADNVNVVNAVQAADGVGDVFPVDD